MERQARLLTIAAFSMVEVLVVLVILAVILSIAFPTYGHLRDRSRAIVCIENLSTLGNALNLYLHDHNQTMPVLLAGRSSLDEAGPTIDTVLAEYIDSPESFRCPSDDELHAKTGTSYFWNSALNGQPVASLRFLLTTDQGRIPILADKENFHRGVGDEVNLLYADGHVEKEVRFFIDPAR